VSGDIGVKWGLSMKLSSAVAAMLVVAGTAPVLAQDISGEALSAHNALRAQHGVPALKWSGKLAGVAQAYADKCVFEHNNTGYGENLAQATDPSVTAMINDWYSEIGMYDFASGTGDGTGHFTQVVWKSTTQVGCGLAQCTDGAMLVCNYSPAGNMDGGYVENVPPRK
jgi:uncharacterized protein YkwD